MLLIKESSFSFSLFLSLSFLSVSLCHYVTLSRLLNLASARSLSRLLAPSNPCSLNPFLAPGQVYINTRNLWYFLHELVLAGFFKLVSAIAHVQNSSCLHSYKICWVSLLQVFLRSHYYASWWGSSINCPRTKTTVTRHWHERLRRIPFHEWKGFVSNLSFPGEYFRSPFPCRMTYRRSTSLAPKQGRLVDFRWFLCILVTLFGLSLISRVLCSKAQMKSLNTDRICLFALPTRSSAFGKSSTALCTRFL